MKIALLGCGGVAKIHAECLRRVGRNVEMIAVSRDEERARQAAQVLHANGWLANYETAINDPDTDAIFVLTPHDQHAAHAAAGLRNGKHVYLEKPAACTVAEAKPILEAHRAAPDRILMVGENFHYIPALREAFRLLRAGEIGELQSVIANAVHCVQPKGWRTRKAECGGGGLIDGGIHEIHALRMIGGEIEMVSAFEPKAKFNKMEGEEAVQILLHYQSGATATMNFSWAYNGNPPLPEFIIVGTHGSILIRLREGISELHKIGEKPRPIEVTKRFGKPDFLLRRGHEGAAAEFLNCIQTGRQPEMNLEEGLRDLRIVEAAYESMARKTCVTISPCQ